MSTTVGAVTGPTVTDAGMDACRISLMVTLSVSLGGLYINVHTNAYSGGQIRGQVQKVVAMATPSVCSDASAAAKASFGVVALLAMVAALLQ